MAGELNEPIRRGKGRMTIRAVFLDVGETVINETRPWSLLADRIEVPRMTFFSVLGALIVEGRNHRELLEIVRPDLEKREDFDRLINETDYRFLPEDVYGDVRPCLIELKRRGYYVGVAGNQAVEREDDIRGMGLTADSIATSGRWGVAKPEPAFFERLIAECGYPAGEIVYVGDRVDNDIVPADRAGMIPVHIVRGPWGHLHRNRPDARRARAQIRTLSELPAAVESL